MLSTRLTHDPFPKAKVHFSFKGHRFQCRVEHFTQSIKSVRSQVNKVGLKLAFEKVEAYVNIDLGVHFFPSFFVFYYFL